jgi:hypothetical protein
LLLLQAVAAAQTGDLEVARRGFEQWLPELAADWVSGTAYGLGQAFLSAGLKLPVHETEPADRYRMMVADGWPPGSTSLH